MAPEYLAETKKNFDFSVRKKFSKMEFLGSRVLVKGIPRERVIGSDWKTEIL